MVSIKRPICPTCNNNLNIRNKMYRITMNTRKKDGINSVNVPVGWLCLICKGTLVEVGSYATNTKVI